MDYLKYKYFLINIINFLNYLVLTDYMELSDIIFKTKSIILEHKDQIINELYKLDNVLNFDVIYVKKLTKAGSIIHKSNPKDIENLLEKLYNFNLEGIKILETQENNYSLDNIASLKSHFYGHAATFSRELWIKTKNNKWLENSYSLNYKSGLISKDYDLEYSSITFTYAADDALDLLRKTKNIDYGNKAIKFYSDNAIKLSEFNKKQAGCAYQSLRKTYQLMYKLTKDILFIEKAYDSEKKALNLFKEIRENNFQFHSKLYLIELAKENYDLTHIKDWKIISNQYYKEIKNIDLNSDNLGLEEYNSRLINVANFTNKIFNKNKKDIFWKKESYNFNLKSIRLNPEPSITNYSAYLSLFSSTIRFFEEDNNLDHIEEGIGYLEKLIDKKILDKRNIHPTMIFFMNKYKEIDTSTELDIKVFNIYTKLNRFYNREMYSKFLVLTSLDILTKNHKKFFENYFIENYSKFYNSILAKFSLRKISKIVRKINSSKWQNFQYNLFKDKSKLITNREKKYVLGVQIREEYAASQDKKWLDLYGEIFLSIFEKDKLNQNSKNKLGSSRRLLDFYFHNYKIDKNESNLDKIYGHILEIEELNVNGTHKELDYLKDIIYDIIGTYKISKDNRFKIKSWRYFNKMKELIKDTPEFQSKLSGLKYNLVNIDKFDIIKRRIDVYNVAKKSKNKYFKTKNNKYIVEWGENINIVLEIDKFNPNKIHALETANLVLEYQIHKYDSNKNQENLNELYDKIIEIDQLEKPNSHECLNEMKNWIYKLMDVHKISNDQRFYDKAISFFGNMEKIVSELNTYKANAILEKCMRME